MPNPGLIAGTVPATTPEGVLTPEMRMFLVETCRDLGINPGLLAGTAQVYLPGSRTMTPEFRMLLVNLAIAAGVPPSITAGTVSISDENGMLTPAFRTFLTELFA